MLPVDRVEGVCINLTPLMKNTIRAKILMVEAPAQYSVGQALVFWLAEQLTADRVLSTEKIRLVLEEFNLTIQIFGDKLEAAMDEVQACRSVGQMKKLPACKFGLLDMKEACIDGQATFLDLETGESFPSIDKMPLRALVYNLTTLFMRYRTQASRPVSVPQNTNEGNDGQRQSRDGVSHRPPQRQHAGGHPG